MSVSASPCAATICSARPNQSSCSCHRGLKQARYALTQPHVRELYQRPEVERRAGFGLARETLGSIGHVLGQVVPKRLKSRIASLAIPAGSFLTNVAPHFDVYFWPCSDPVQFFGGRHQRSTYCTIQSHQRAAAPLYSAGGQRLSTVSCVLTSKSGAFLLTSAHSLDKTLPADPARRSTAPELSLPYPNQYPSIGMFKPACRCSVLPAAVGSNVLALAPRLIWTGHW